MKTFTLAFGQKNPPKKITSSSSGKEDDECLIKKCTIKYSRGGFI